MEDRKAPAGRSTAEGAGREPRWGRLLIGLVLGASALWAAFAAGQGFEGQRREWRAERSRAERLACELAVVQRKIERMLSLDAEDRAPW